MLTYEIATGKLYVDHDGALMLVSKGYSGKGDGLNNPEMVSVHEEGPIPPGDYTVGEAHTHPHLGPVTMDLTPDSDNEMFGRDDFRVHGDNSAMNHTGSEGCIILGRAARELIESDPDHRLRVVSQV